MASQISYPVVDDKDLDDAALWAVIDSATGSHSSFKSKSLVIKYPNFQSPIPKSSPKKFSKTTRNSYSSATDSRLSDEGEVVHEPWVYRPPRKIAKTCASESSESSPLAMVRNVQALQRTPRTSVYSSPEAYLSPEIGRFSVKELSTCSDVSPGSNGWSEEKENMRHALSGIFPTVSLFKEYQNAAMAILDKSDYTLISGNPFIRKTGWRKISCYFNISYEIRDKDIEFDDNHNVQRAEFVVRAYMQGGRFSDGWGSCERREKRFSKPNHDIPSTAETRAKNRACQDLLGIGEYRPGASQVQR
ncbi:Peptide transporter family protein [Quillaja saponaria]|uniref:Peptide transporter family protein n=1 Tax=Quillaja saponaria TaxID=32244 RepID=A0AAD7L2U2_QUISA|nr:Peptide transporter family protein [Quillaja saponaria]